MTEFSFFGWIIPLNYIHQTWHRLFKLLFVKLIITTVTCFDKWIYLLHDCVIYVMNHTLFVFTFMSSVEGCKCDHKEGGGVFPSIHQVREGPPGVTVTSQTLNKPQPGRQTVDDGPNSIRIAVTPVITLCRRRQLWMHIDISKTVLSISFSKITPKLYKITTNTTNNSLIQNI